MEFKTYPLLTEDKVPEDLPYRGELLRFRSAPLTLLFRRMFDLCSVPARGLLHLGAHSGDDILGFLCLGFRKIVSVDPHPRAFPVLERTVEYLNREVLGRFQFLFGEEGAQTLYAYNVAVGAKNGTATLSLNAKNPEWSSLMDVSPGQEMLRPEQFTERVTVPLMTVDGLLDTHGHDKRDFNVLYANVEGYELEVLKGATETLPGIEFAYLEVNLVAHHVGDPSVQDLEAFMTEAGFVRRWSFSAPAPPDHGYLVYARKTPHRP